MTLLQVRDSLDQVTTTTRPPTSPQWAAPYGSGPPARRGRTPTIALGVVGLLALAALILGIIGLTRQTSTTSASSTSTMPAAPAAPAFTAGETAAAHKQFCAVVDLAVRAVKSETNGPDRALARIALTNSAAMIESASSNPALSADDRDAARSVAEAYWATVATSSVAASDTPQFQASVDQANQAASRIVAVCGQ